MNGLKTSGSNSRVCAMAVMILDRRDPVRFQAVRSSDCKVAGQWAPVLTVMMHFSSGIRE